jgi:hypothetical protein
MRKKNCRIARNTIRRQDMSHISNAFTELEIGAEHLQKSYCNITEVVLIALPDIIEHVEKEETDAEQVSNPGNPCRQGKRCLESRYYLYKLDITNHLPNLRGPTDQMECRQITRRG